MNKSRILSITKTKMVVYLTKRNLIKFKKEGWLHVFEGHWRHSWINRGSFKIIEVFNDETMDIKGITFYRCNLKRIDPAKYGLDD